ncbi:hypothetical protein LMG31884_46430 (plasmid) [Xanthomonas hydrangeae]|uniref:hypothetical protein n=1 Tax=Xanthomonas hydrangeae TaxID=2775159 RepID=UPI001AF57058|nr:hypothetical protein LMG31884_46430 [Xanthomonas hydrangeae]CAD7740252.1 hypothetical protein LMG31884_46430 [Xanthomonas hydrangeae]
MTTNNTQIELPVSHGLAKAVLRGQLLNQLGAAYAANQDAGTGAAALAAREALATHSDLTDAEARAVLTQGGVQLCNR